MENKHIIFDHLPDDIQKEIAAYLDSASLSFFALSSKRSLLKVLPMLRERQKTLLCYPNIMIIARGDTTFCYHSQTLFACGSNEYGQLGLGHNNSCNTLTPIKNIPGKIQQVTLGWKHTLVLTDQGLYACGYNKYGQLGLGIIIIAIHLSSLKTFPVRFSKS